MSIENINLVGKVTPDGREDVVRLIQEHREAAKNERENEIEMTWETAVIELVIRFINEERVGLGLEPVENVTLENFHLFEEEEFLKRFGHRGGTTNPFTQNVYLSKGNRSKLFFVHNAVHEIIHLFSHRKYLVVEKEEETRVAAYRSGYSISDEARKESGEQFEEKFSYLEEAIADKIAIEIVKKHLTQFAQALQLTEEALNTAVAAYYDEIDVLNAIIDGVAIYKKENVAATWRRIKRGEFSGEMMHLRDIERAYGRGSLKLLAALKIDIMGEDMVKNEEIAKKNKKIKEYFTLHRSDDEEWTNKREAQMAEIFASE